MEEEINNDSNIEDYVLDSIYKLVEDCKYSLDREWSKSLLKHAIVTNKIIKPKILASVKSYQKFFEDTGQDIRDYFDEGFSHENHHLMTMIPTDDIAERLIYDFRQGCLTKDRIKKLLGERTKCWITKEEWHSWRDTIFDPPTLHYYIFSEFALFHIEIYEQDIKELDKNYKDLVEPIKHIPWYYHLHK